MNAITDIPPVIQARIMDAVNARPASKVFDSDRRLRQGAHHADARPAFRCRCTWTWRRAVMFAFGYRAKAPEHPKTRRTMADTVSWF